jgi:hypothetical protein
VCPLRATTVCEHSSEWTESDDESGTSVLPLVNGWPYRKVVKPCSLLGNVYLRRVFERGKIRPFSFGERAALFGNGWGKRIGIELWGGISGDGDVGKNGGTEGDDGTGGR